MWAESIEYCRCQYSYLSENSFKQISKLLEKKAKMYTYINNLKLSAHKASNMKRIKVIHVTYLWKYDIRKHWKACGWNMATIKRMHPWVQSVVGNDGQIQLFSVLYLLLSISLPILVLLIHLPGRLYVYSIYFILFRASYNALYM